MNEKIDCTPPKKACTSCGVEKPLGKFSKNSQLKSGLNSRCKACDKLKNAKRKSKVAIGWDDIAKMSFSPEQEFEWLYGGATVNNNGHFFMKDGVVLDQKWYKSKIDRIKKGTRLRGGEIAIKEEQDG